MAAVHDPADLRRPRADPGSLLEASADLGGRSRTTFRRVVLPLVFPALVAGSIFTFSLTLGDYITPDLVSDAKFIGNVIYDNSSLGNLPLAAAYSLLPIVDHDRLPPGRAPPRRVRVPVRPPMTESRGTGSCSASRRRWSSRSSTCRCHPGDLRLQREPAPGLAADRVHARLVRRGARRTRRRRGVRQLAHRSATVATAIALVLGTLAALAVQRYSFFGRADDLVPARSCRSRCRASSPASPCARRS